MRDAKKIIEKFFTWKEWDWGDQKELQRFIEETVARLYMDEEVITLIKGTPNRFYLLTDKNRLIVSFMSKQDGSGFFSSPTYNFLVDAFDLEKIDFKKASMRIVKDGFMSSHFEIVVDQNNANDKQNDRVAVLNLTFKDETQGQTAYKQILSHKKKYTPKPIEEKQPVQTVVKTSDDGSSKIKEIRALYEDGIITKEEMLDLLKEALKK